MSYNPYPPMPAPPPSTGVGATSQADAAQRVADYQQYIATIQAAMKQASGWERIKLDAQRQDAQKGLQNAMAIAQLQAQTSRYGTDANTRAQMAQLQENQRQFDLNHGLNVAKAYTEFASTPDDIWMLQDFKGALANIQQGGGPTPLAAQASPHAKNASDFAALTGYNLPAVRATQAGSANPASPAGTSTATPSAPASAPAAGGGGAAPSTAPGAATAAAGGGTDPRVTAANAVMRAIPPSGTPGNDTQDWAALNAIQNLYFAGRPGEVERLGNERRRIAMGGLKRLGYDPKLVEEERVRGLPGQQSPRYA